MSEDLPSDVVAVITQLCEKTRQALSEGDCETARAAVDTIERVATNKLPEGEHRQTVRHACERIAAVLADDETDDALAYVEALERRFPAAP